MLNSALRALREARGWSQSNLALTAGLTRTTVGDYERGTTSPTPETLRRLARALGVPVRELLAEPLTGLPSLDSRREHRDLCLRTG